MKRKSCVIAGLTRNLGLIQWGNTQVELFLIDNVPALDLFWIAAQGRNDVCGHPLQSEWSWYFMTSLMTIIMIEN
ncbi:MAG: hypothetical protein LBV04_01590, partial [Deferribacteraceae bacterium]|jgi:hypothetical protein|nr:hypothetical protein [Deferribacteraceae bacterium]